MAVTPHLADPRARRGHRSTGRPAVVRQREIVLHGQQVTFLETGTETGGPTVVLLHGLASSSQTRAAVMPLLGAHAHVIAPDLLGHGRSAKPHSGDCSLGAYAAGLGPGSIADSQANAIASPRASASTTGRARSSWCPSPLTGC